MLSCLKKVWKRLGKFWEKLRKGDGQLDGKSFGKGLGSY
jgi:hypothetical protein